MNQTVRQATCSVIVLTMGDRNVALTELVRSLEGESFDGVLVGNGVEPMRYDGWRSLSLKENVGISAGRAFGADNARESILVFIDDDCRNRTEGLLASIAQAFDEDPSLGALALRVVVTGTEVSLSEWQPRLRGRGDCVPGDVTSFHGAAHAIRARAYCEVGGYPAELFYAHEETDLAWRLLDARWRVAYRPDLTLEHPLTKPSRHANHLWYSARNRVWIARRNLPGVVLAGYLGIWLAIQLVRCRSFGEVGSVAKGTVDGLRSCPLPRAPMSWRTVLKMSKLGRPPII